MRTNLPVTGKELMLADDAMIVSKTNLKGQITYINKDFLDVSGFTEAELIGEPHNIVRHPDMPVQAYEDMWATLKAGRPWIGLVKNRCKNGDHYWVEAYSLQSAKQRIIGYLMIDVPQAAIDSDQLEFELTAGKGVIASRLNITQEHFSRVLHDLSDSGLLEVHGKKIRIPSVSKLLKTQDNP